VDIDHNNINATNIGLGANKQKHCLHKKPHDLLDLNPKGKLFISTTSKKPNDL
jgi:hypothetical protein